MASRLHFRTAKEDHAGFEWSPANRETHFLKHGIDFPIVASVDWSRIKKAPDLRQAHDPPRFVAIANCPAMGRPLVIVYAKANNIARIISVRLANHDETTLLDT